MVPELVAAYFAENQNLLWLIVVLLDLSLTLLLYRLYGKMGLYAVVILNIMLCNMMGPKITNIFGFNTTMGAILYSGIYFATDLLGERYGKREANRAVFIGFAVSVLVIVMTQLSLLFQPTTLGERPADLAARAHASQDVLFNMTPRFVLGSLLAYLISQTHDVWLFHVIKDLTAGRHLWLRNNVSTIVSQSIDTVVYAFVVWWGYVSLHEALALGAAKYMFKVIIALLDTPFIYWARSWDIHDKDWNDAAADAPEPALAGLATTLAEAEE
ncbi:MAG: queuosine precursor transporter [Candidatus Hydrogenedentes bacterium]|nr:queuosine precursor transporter [Candidatus Hydrogenedentota bacterium]